MRSLSGDDAVAVGAAFSADGRYVAASDANGVLRVWEVETAAELARAADFPSNHHSSFRSRRIIFSREGDVVVYVTADAGVRVWEWRRDRTVRHLAGHPQPPTHVAITPDHQIVAISGGYGFVRELNGATPPIQSSRQPLVVIAWDLATGARTSQWRNDHSGIFNAALSPDGTLVATSGAPGLPREFKDMPKDAVFHPELIVWDSATGQPLAREGVQTVTNDLRFSPDARLLGTSNQNGVLRASRSLEPLRALPFSQPTFTRDGTRIGAAHDATKPFLAGGLHYLGLPIPPPPKPSLRVEYAEVATGKKLRSRDIRTESRTAPLAWNGDLSMFIDRKLRLWKLPS